METIEERRAARQRRNAMFEKDVSEWTTAELIEVLTDRVNEHRDAIMDLQGKVGG